MKFTIIIPAYNVEAYIDECLASVAAQSYGDWEAIVVDDGSTDGTGEKCDEWGSKDERIRVVHQAILERIQTFYILKPIRANYFIRQIVHAMLIYRAFIMRG